MNREKKERNRKEKRRYTLHISSLFDKQDTRGWKGRKKNLRNREKGKKLERKKRRNTVAIFVHVSCKGWEEKKYAVQRGVKFGTRPICPTWSCKKKIAFNSVRKFLLRARESLSTKQTRQLSLNLPFSFLFFLFLFLLFDLHPLLPHISNRIPRVLSYEYIRSTDIFYSW